MAHTGVWLIGARGNVATMATVGARAIARGLTTTTGMVTARDPVASLDVPPVDELVFGGHEIRRGSLFEKAIDIAERNGVPREATVEAVRSDLDAVDDRIVTGTAANAGETVAALADDDVDSAGSLRDLVDRIRTDYRSFRRENDLDRVVVVNVASTEATVPDPDRFDDLASFERALDADEALPASTLYAYAALVDGHPYVNFTPSTGSDLGALRELADSNDVPHAGRDAKTGETLVKSALAPMFAGRNLRVLSWEGHNILGNEDGLVLEDEANKASKLQSKGDLLESILPDIGHNRVRIDYTPSLNDWKTAWDYIHFEGFLDTEMKMQFTWEGSDSALAAPLVLDLVRLVAFADDRGDGGLQPHLASFFKAPMGVDEHDLSRQLTWLYEYADRHRSVDTDAATPGQDDD